MDGADLGRLHEAFLSAYDFDSLAMLLRLKLDKRLDALVSPGADLRTAVFQLLTRAEREGWLNELVERAVEDRTGKPEFVATCEETLTRLVASKGTPRVTTADGIGTDSAAPKPPTSDTDNLVELAIVYEQAGRYNEAEPLFERALQIRQSSLPEGHRDIASSLYDLGYLYRIQRRFPEAEPLLTQALEMRQTSLPKGHPDVPRTLHVLAKVYEALGRYEEAEVLLNRALTILQSTVREPHRDIATSLGSLGILYRDQQRWAEAEPLLVRALAMRRDVFPDGHRDTAASLTDLGIFFRLRGQYKDAEPLLEEALAMREKLLPAGHESLTITRKELALVYREQGRYREAEGLLQPATTLVEKPNARASEGGRTNEQISPPHTLSAEISLAELRLRMTKGLNRGEVAALWFDLFGTTLDNDLPGKSQVECVIELLARAGQRNKQDTLKEILARSVPHILDTADPR